MPEFKEGEIRCFKSTVPLEGRSCPSYTVIVGDDPENPQQVLCLQESFKDGQYRVVAAPVKKSTLAKFTRPVTKDDTPIDPVPGRLYRRTSGYPGVLLPNRRGIEAEAFDINVRDAVMGVFPLVRADWDDDDLVALKKLYDYLKKNPMSWKEPEEASEPLTEAHKPLAVFTKLKVRETGLPAFIAKFAGGEYTIVRENRPGAMFRIQCVRRTRGELERDFSVIDADTDAQVAVEPGRWCIVKTSSGSVWFARSTEGGGYSDLFYLHGDGCIHSSLSVDPDNFNGLLARGGIRHCTNADVLAAHPIESMKAIRDHIREVEARYAREKEPEVAEYKKNDVLVSRDWERTAVIVKLWERNSGEEQMYTILRETGDSSRPFVISHLNQSGVKRRYVTAEQARDSSERKQNADWFLAEREGYLHFAHRNANGEVDDVVLLNEKGEVFSTRLTALNPLLETLNLASGSVIVAALRKNIAYITRVLAFIKKLDTNTNQGSTTMSEKKSLLSKITTPSVSFDQPGDGIIYGVQLGMTRAAQDKAINLAKARFPEFDKMCKDNPKLEMVGRIVIAGMLSMSAQWAERKAEEKGGETTVKVAKSLRTTAGMLEVINGEDASTDFFLWVFTHLGELIQLIGDLLPGLSASDVRGAISESVDGFDEALKAFAPSASAEEVK